MGTTASPDRTEPFDFDFPRLLPKGKRPADKPRFEARCLTAAAMADVEDQIQASFTQRGRASVKHLVHALGLLIVAGQACDLQGKLVRGAAGQDDATRWQPLTAVYEMEQLWLLYRRALAAIRPSDDELGKSASPSDADTASSAPTAPPVDA